MDFPVCPGCGQSVIDDDAVDCPFCGSPMKGGKGGVKPKPASSAAVKNPGAASGATTPARPTGTPQAGSQTPRQTKSPKGDDLPFESSDAADKAVQVSAGPARQRTLRVQCPMCDTPGFAPDDAAGKPVRCVNKKCLAPVFNAPYPEPVAAPPPPSKSKGNPVVTGGITAAILVVGGGIAYFVALQPDYSQGPIIPVRDPGPAVVTVTTPTATTTTTGGQAPDGTTSTANTPPPVDPGQLRAAFLARVSRSMTEAALLPLAQNRSKPYCRQQLAVVRTQLGDVTGVKTELTALDDVGREVPYYKIEPLTQIYWQQQNSGDTQAPATAQLAMTLFSSLPRVGTLRLEVASELAAVQIAAGSHDQATEVLAAHSHPEIEGQIAACNVLALSAGLWRADLVHDRAPVLNWQSPQLVATLGILVHRGESAAAMKFVSGSLTGDQQVEGAAAIAEWSAIDLLSKGNKTPDPGLESFLQSFSGLPGAFVRARYALALGSGGEKELALPYASAATTELSALPTVESLAFPSVKETSTRKLPDPKPLRLRCAAEFELAHAWGALNRPDEFRAALERGLAVARGVSPSPVAVFAKTSEVEAAGPTQMRELLTKELGLKSDDAARLAYSEYRRGLTLLTEAATLRQSWHTAALMQAAVGHHPEKVWAVIETNQNVASGAVEDNWMQPELIGTLLHQLSRKKLTTIATAVEAAWAQAGPGEMALPAVVSLHTAIESGNPEQVAALLAEIRGPELELHSLIATSKLTSSVGFKAAQALVPTMSDIVIREKAWRLAGALAARRGESEAVWAQISALRTATERIALSTGFTAGSLTGLSAVPVSVNTPQP